MRHAILIGPAVILTTALGVAAPAAAAAQPSALSAVSCPARTACMAVGAQGLAATTALAERWNGTRWTVVPTPPTGRKDTTLAAVSCSAAGACTAVGYTQSGQGLAYPGTPLAERWNGTTWTIQPIPEPRGENISAYIAGVSCPSATQCVAVGYYSVNGAGEGTIAESWNGRSWRLYSFTFPSGELLSVSCAGVDNCDAAGTFGFQTLVYRWDGTSWRVQPTPNPAPPEPGDQLNAVGCTAVPAEACQAVGIYGTGDASQSTFGLGWNAAAWTIENTPSPGNHAWLAGVSCATAALCIAVGSHPVPTVGTLPLLAEWNGSGWSTQRAPLALGSMDGVSCATTSACTAVGVAEGGTGKPLIEGWNGRTWSVQKPG